MTCSKFARRLFRHFIFVFSFSSLCTLQLFAQNGGMQDALYHSLSGTTVISTILIGGRAAPLGYLADYPVETLVYPPGDEVAYRMDLGTTSTSISAQELRRYFDRGTSFQVSGFDLQDGWLELKLKSAGGEYARVRLMLGAGWQSKFDSTSIQAQLACVFILDQKPRPKQRTVVPVGFGETVIPKEHGSPSKGTHVGAGMGGEVFGKLGRTG